MMKRCFTLVLALTLLLCSTAPAAEAVYEDGSGLKLSDWAVDSHHKANTYDILNWFHRGGDFTAPITRAEFCDMVFNTMNAAQNGLTAEIDVLAPSPFTDTDRFSVFALAQLGIVKGVGDGLFAPDAVLTREQAATFIARAGEILAFTYLPEDSAAFTDAAAIAPWAEAAADTMRASGLMIGTDTGAFLPQSLLTREQAAAVLVRFLEKNGFNSGIYIKDADHHLTLEDFAALNGKYRPLGENAYEITYYQGNFANVVVRVNDGNIESAVFTYTGSGISGDLTKETQDDIMTGHSYTGRTYLGSDAWQVDAEGQQSLMLGGETVLSLPSSEYGGINYQKMGGAYVAYAIKGGRTVFFDLKDGSEKFAVAGTISLITNQYIITGATKYPEDATVDAAYTVYGVYSLDGEQMEAMGLGENELYQKGYITDD